MNFRTKLLFGLGCFYGSLTGCFFGLPALSPLVGAVGIGIALLYCGCVCWLRQLAQWLAIGLATAFTIVYVLITHTEFSVINFAVLMTIVLNVVIFGQLEIALLNTMPWQRSWLIAAGLFGGSLGLGWSVALIVS